MLEKVVSFLLGATAATVIVTNKRCPIKTNAIYFRNPDFIPVLQKHLQCEDIVDKEIRGNVYYEATFKDNQVNSA